MSESKVAVITAMRANPPHKGHELVYKKINKFPDDVEKAVYLSKTHEYKKNPLSPEDKIKFVKKMFPGVNVDFMPGGVVQTVKLYDGYDKLYIVVGEDRVEEYKRLIGNYNGKEYNIGEIIVQDAGTREGTWSATRMRKFASEDDYDSFKADCSSKLSDGDISDMFELTKKGLVKPEKKTRSKKVIKSSFAAAGRKIVEDVMESKPYFNKQAIENELSSIFEKDKGSIVLINYPDVFDPCGVWSIVYNSHYIPHQDIQRMVNDAELMESLDYNDNINLCNTIKKFAKAIYGISCEDVLIPIVNDDNDGGLIAPYKVKDQDNTYIGEITLSNNGKNNTFEIQKLRQ